MPIQNNSPVRQQLSELLNHHAEAVANWLRQAFQETPACFYSSVDIRHSGHKLVPVDTNLFPAGFNHLSRPSRNEAVRYITHFMQRQNISPGKAMIIPENHTRNLKYHDNLLALSAMLNEAGMQVRIGSLKAEAGEPLELEDSGGNPLIQYPLVKQGTQLATEDGFVPDVIIVNNDMTSGSPEILKGLTQCVVPQIGLGWYRRKKSIHFDAYTQVAHQFADQFNLDPWLIAAIHHKCGRVHFKERKGIECVALGVDKVLRHVQEKYDAYGIKDTPYAFVKADTGTYGMGIMIVHSGDEIIEMNKKNRNKMNTIKAGTTTSEVIIQEGVPTVDRVDGAIAEPMVYLFDGHPVGGAYRVNEERDPYNNLNAKGMRFVPMCEEEASECMSRSPIALISQLATLAASREEYGDHWVI